MYLGPLPAVYTRSRRAIRLIAGREVIRLAIIVSHPIQYYVPLYRRLSQRSDLELKVFYTWHGGERAILDEGFKKEVAWDIPLRDGYQFEIVPNVARKPGTHHFGGLRNPALTKRVLMWQPDVVHLTGYAYASHLRAMEVFHRQGLPILFRGDSHLLDGGEGWKWLLKRALLTTIYRWPTVFLYVGQANREYYSRFGVPDPKLHYCPHSIEVSRFAEPNTKWEAEAREWRSGLGLSERQRVCLFVGKFEDIKQPIALMRAFLEMNDSDLVLVMVGDGELGPQVDMLARNFPDRFRVLPFQNQSRMPVVYRLGNVVVLPSTSETWGLTVNEAFACGRPVLVSDRVGCAVDLVKSGQTGEVFRTGDWSDFKLKVRATLKLSETLNRPALIRFANSFDIEITEKHLMNALARFS